MCVREREKRFVFICRTLCPVFRVKGERAGGRRRKQLMETSLSPLQIIAFASADYCRSSPYADSVLRAAYDGVDAGGWVLHVPLTYARGR